MHAAFVFAIFGTMAYPQVSTPPAADAPRDLSLFLLIGQSNMAGRGEIEAQDREPLAGVWKLDRNGQWVPATDPIHFDKPSAGVGLARSFAAVLRAHNPTMKIGLIPCAVGGTSLDKWQPDGQLFKEAVARTRHAMLAGRLGGILWHQGEGDSSAVAKAESYAERWIRMMRALRSELGAERTPVVVGALGEFMYVRKDGMYRSARIVNEQLASIAAADNRVRFVSSAGLEHKGDELHFSAAALRELGRRYAREYLSFAPGTDNRHLPK